MRTVAPLCAAALAAVAFLAPSVRAQLQAFSEPDPDRKCSSLLLAEVKGERDFTLKGAVAINYSAPQWQDKYDAQLDSPEFKGKNQRFGKNWWTSLETTVALDIGGAKVAPGVYYLGINMDQAGKLSLLLMDAKTAMTKGWAPFKGDDWKPDVKAPLTLAKNSLSQKVEKMEIAITADEKKPTTGKFSIRWGKHEASAPVTFQVAGPKDASGDKEAGK